MRKKMNETDFKQYADRELVKCQRYKQVFAEPYLAEEAEHRLVITSSKYEKLKNGLK
jgi:hypothetical protein